MPEISTGRTAAQATAEGNKTLAELHSSTLRFAAIRALVSIGCPEQLRDGPLTVAELASRCGAHAPTLARLLRSVAVTGLLRTVSPCKYELTDAGQALLEGRELQRMRWNVDPEAWRSLGELTETVRTGQAPFLLRHGSTYDYLSTRQESAAAFDALMVANHSHLAARLAEVGDFSGASTVVDVGGGRGTFLTAVLRAHPGLRGILLDLERAVPTAKEYLAANGVDERCEVVAGDFFASVPAGADAYLLAHVIHNWDDAQAAGILRTVRAAMPGNGRILIIEAPLPDDDRPYFVKDLDIRLLTMHGGKERSQSEYVALLAGAGLRPGPVTELAFGSCLITASPAEP
jgi:hypothetical protein